MDEVTTHPTLAEHDRMIARATETWAAGKLRRDVAQTDMRPMFEMVDFKKQTVKKIADDLKAEIIRRTPIRPSGFVPAGSGVSFEMTLEEMVQFVAERGL